MAVMNRFVKNGTVRKFWLTETTGPPPEVILNILVGRNPPKFQESLHELNGNIRGLHVSIHCSMVSEVMESFLSLFLFSLFLSIKHASELPDFGTVAASEVNRSVVTA